MEGIFVALKRETARMCIIISSTTKYMVASWWGWKNLSSRRHIALISFPFRILSKFKFRRHRKNVNSSHWVLHFENISWFERKKKESHTTILLHSQHSAAELFFFLLIVPIYFRRGFVWKAIFRQQFTVPLGIFTLWKAQQLKSIAVNRLLCAQSHFPSARAAWIILQLCCWTWLWKHSTARWMALYTLWFMRRAKKKLSSLSTSLIAGFGELRWRENVAEIVVLCIWNIR